MSITNSQDNKEETCDIYNPDFGYLHVPVEAREVSREKISVNLQYRAEARIIIAF